MNSSSSEDEGEADVLWDNPKDVDWQFMKTGHSKLEGVVVTHDKNFKYQKNQKSRKGDTWYYHCSQKIPKGCPAKATIKRLETITESGELIVENNLVAVSSPIVHAEFHLPDHCAIIADSLVEMMKKEIQLDPLIPVGRIKEKILRQELHLSEKYSEDEVSQILSILPVRVESTLHNYRVGMLGTSAKDRDSYDPSQVRGLTSSGMSSVLPSLTPSPRETSGGRRRLETAWPRMTSSVRSRRTRPVFPCRHPRPGWWPSSWWMTEPRCLPALNFSN